MAVVLVLVSLWGVFVCVGATMAMDEHKGHGSQECGTEGAINGCQMNILDHITRWQNSLTSTFDFSATLSLFVILAFTVIFFVQKQFLFSHQPNFSVERFQFYERSHPEQNLFNHLLRMFSQGILHPKLHA